MERKKITVTETLANCFSFIKEQLKLIDEWFLLNFLSFLAIVGLFFVYGLLLFGIIVSSVFISYSLAFLIIIFVGGFLFIEVLKKIISFINIPIFNSLDVALHRPMRRFEQRDNRLGVFALWFLIFIIILFGLLFLVIPGIYFMVRASMSYPIYLEEKCSPFQAIVKSFEMTRGNFWSLLMPVAINYFLIITPILNIINLFFIPFSSWNKASIYAQLKNR